MDVVSFDMLVRQLNSDLCIISRDIPCRDCPIFSTHDHTCSENTILYMTKHYPIESYKYFLKEG